MLKEAEAVQRLRDSGEFRKVHKAMELAVAQAQNDLEVNTNPHADAYYKLIWQSRKHMLACIDEFIDATIEKRRGAVQEFLRSLGIPEERIQNNLDDPLDFLMPASIGGPEHGN